jgi:MinD-like ATPase involved in chromosome partitioning or flagellar assembly
VGSLRFLLGPHDPLQAKGIQPGAITSIIDVLAKMPTVDLVVIDCGPEVISNMFATAAVQSSDRVLLVADRDPQSLTDVDGSYNWLVEEGKVDRANISFVINRCDPSIRDADLLNEIGRCTGVPVDITIPNSPEIIKALGSGKSTDRYLRILEDQPTKQQPITNLLSLQQLVKATVPQPSRRK